MQVAFDLATMEPIMGEAVARIPTLKAALDPDARRAMGGRGIARPAQKH